MKLGCARLVVGNPRVGCAFVDLLFALDAVSLALLQAYRGDLVGENWAGGADFSAQAAFKLVKVVDERPSEFASRCAIRVLILPGLGWEQQLGRHMRHMGDGRYPEIRIHLSGRVGEHSVVDRINDGARVREFNAMA